MPSSFLQAASLVPIGIVGEVGYLYSPTQARLFTVEAKHSVFWFDWLAFRDRAVGSRLRRVAAVLRESAQVPVVLRYAFSVRRFYADWGEGEQPDGLAMALDVPDHLAGCVEGAAAAGLSACAPRPLWTIALSDDVVEGPFPQTHDLIATLACAGAKGWFVQVPRVQRRWPEFSDLRPLASGPSLLADLRWLPRQTLADYQPEFCFWYPPCPADARAWNPDPGLVGLDGGWGEGMALFKHGRWIVPATQPPAPDALTVTSLYGPPASEHYALSIERMLRSNARLTFVGQRLDLGLIPSLDRLFRPLPSGAIGFAPQPLASINSDGTPTEALGSTPTGDIWHLRSGNLEIVSVPASDAFQVVEWLDVPRADHYYSPRQMADLLFGEGRPGEESRESREEQRGSQ